MHALTLWYDAHLEPCFGPILTTNCLRYVNTVLKTDVVQTECSYLTFHSSTEDINISKYPAN